AAAAGQVVQPLGRQGQAAAGRPHRRRGEAGSRAVADREVVRHAEAGDVVWRRAFAAFRWEGPAVDGLGLEEGRRAGEAQLCAPAHANSPTASAAAATRLPSTTRA